MWKIVICDDELPICVQLKRYLSDFSKETGEEFEIAEFHSAEELLAAENLQPHVLLLDISMGDITGMQAAKKIREIDNTVIIIFITTMVNYALEGYSVHAFGFIRKPVSYALFRAQMIDTVRALKSRSSESIQLTINGKVQRISLQELLYFEIYGHQIKIVLTDREFDYYGTLSEIEELLNGKSFFRCHRSYLVNLAQIKYFGPSHVEMRGGNTIPVSKYKKNELLEAFAKFVQTNI